MVKVEEAMHRSRKLMKVEKSLDWLIAGLTRAHSLQCGSRNPPNDLRPKLGGYCLQAERTTKSTG